jgi:hypothetical protein
MRHTYIDIDIFYSSHTIMMDLIISEKKDDKIQIRENILFFLMVVKLNDKKEKL